MFLCAFCNRPSKPGEPLRLVAVETRSRRYTGFQKETVGTEIVIEAPQCPRCAGVPETAPAEAEPIDLSAFAGRPAPPAARAKKPPSAATS